MPGAQEGPERREEVQSGDWTRKSTLDLVGWDLSMTDNWILHTGGRRTCPKWFKKRIKYEGVKILLFLVIFFLKVSRQKK